MHERVRRAPRPCICGPAGSVSPVRVSTNVEAPASTLDRAAHAGTGCDRRDVVDHLHRWAPGVLSEPRKSALGSIEPGRAFETRTE